MACCMGATLLRVAPFLAPRHTCGGPDNPLTSAPGRIRTRDPLLRRQLLCPAELRAPEGNCARRMSHDGHTKVAVCRAPEAAPPRLRTSHGRGDSQIPHSVPQPD